ncbi:MAG: multicopper oxidase family protein [Burkholderiaceae bacterium]
MRPAIQAARCAQTLRLVLEMAIGLTLAQAQVLPVQAQGPPWIARALPSLHEFQSSNGVASVVLEAREQTVQIDRITIEAMTYNGDYAGPVIRVHPGDLLKVRLINHLHEPTNIHFHGYQGSPLGASDNMHILVNPGETFDYAVTIPLTQPPGLYWFHSHMHHEAERQVMRGLSGTLIVEGLTDQFPALKGITERLLVFKEDRLESSDDEFVDQYLHRYIRTMSGAIFSQIEMRPGETQLWRIANEGADQPLRLVLKGHTFRIIGRDGSATTRETVTDELQIDPAGRVDALVDAGAAGTYELSSPGVHTGKGKVRPLGLVEVRGLPATGIPTQEAFPVTPDLRTAKIDATRTVVMTQNPSEGEYYLDGKLFNHARVDTRVPLGNVEEWLIRNDTNDYHTFHIHQVSFQVVEINGMAASFEGRRDTIEVPVHGTIKIRMAFSDPLIVGEFMYHCHILEHEDKGMMANIEVYDPALEPAGHAPDH